MTPAEISAVSRLGGYAFAGLVSRIEQVHRAVADRAFTTAGTMSVPARVIHDSITRGVYLAVRGAGTAAGAAGAGDRVASRHRRAVRRP